MKKNTNVIDCPFIKKMHRNNVLDKNVLNYILLFKKKRNKMTDFRKNYNVISKKK